MVCECGKGGVWPRTAPWKGSFCSHKTFISDLVGSSSTLSSSYEPSDRHNNLGRAKTWGRHSLCLALLFFPLYCPALSSSKPGCTLISARGDQPVASQGTLLDRPSLIPKQLSLSVGLRSLNYLNKVLYLFIQLSNFEHLLCAFHCVKSKMKNEVPASECLWGFISP